MALAAGPHGQVLYMEKPFLRYGKASLALVPPQEGALKPEHQEKQLSWDCSVSEHPHPTPLASVASSLLHRLLPEAQPIFSTQLFCQTEGDQLQSRPVRGLWAGNKASRINALLRAGWGWEDCDMGSQGPARTQEHHAP